MPILRWKISRGSALFDCGKLFPVFADIDPADEILGVFFHIGNGHFNGRVAAAAGRKDRFVLVQRLVKVNGYSVIYSKRAYSADSVTDKPTTDTPKPRDTGKEPVGKDTEPAGNVTDDPAQVNVPPAKDWTKLKVMAPTEGTVYKRHDLDNAVFSLTMNDYRVHNGIDIECAAGADVVSCAYGTVKTAGYDPFMGYTVIIDHGDGLISCYRNLSDSLAEGIKEGAAVYAGQKLGTVGESALIEISDDAHLHFELELNGKPIDPLTMTEIKPGDQPTAVTEPPDGK